MSMQDYAVSKGKIKDKVSKSVLTSQCWLIYVFD
jgi:hypothetical protein